MKYAERAEKDKLTHLQVKFEHPSRHPGEKCAGCTHFIAASPSRCESVRPPITRPDWCIRFEPKTGKNPDLEFAAEQLNDAKRKAAAAHKRFYNAKENTPEWKAAWSEWQTWKERQAMLERVFKAKKRNPPRDIMPEFRADKLRTSRGRRVPRTAAGKRQAKAILLSELRQRGEIPPRQNPKRIKLANALDARKAIEAGITRGKFIRDNSTARSSRKELQRLSDAYSIAMGIKSTGGKNPAFNVVRGRDWQQEWYETKTGEARRRAAELRKLGFKVVVEGMGSQITDIGRINLTLVDIRGIGDKEIPPPGKNPVSFSATDKAALTKLWHAARIAGHDSRHARLLYVQREWAKNHPGEGHAAYREIDQSTRGYGHNPKKHLTVPQKHQARVKAMLKRMPKPIRDVFNRNPDAADDLYTSFHGRGPGETLLIDVPSIDPYADHPALAQLGWLISMTVGEGVTKLGGEYGDEIEAVDDEQGYWAEELSFVPDLDEWHDWLEDENPEIEEAKKFLIQKKVPDLAAEPDSRQLFIVGSPNIDLETLEELGADPGKDLLDLGNVYRIEYFTQKRFDKFEPTNYWHHFGEKTKVLPRLIYNRKAGLLQLVGGEYIITPRGIEN